jgi:hypothetical protein
LRYRPAAATSSTGFLSLFMPRGARTGGRSGTGTIGRGSQRVIHILREDDTLEAIPVRVGASADNLSEVSGTALRPGLLAVTGQLAQAP